MKTTKHLPENCRQLDRLLHKLVSNPPAPLLMKRPGGFSFSAHVILFLSFYPFYQQGRIRETTCKSEWLVPHTFPIGSSALTFSKRIEKIIFRMEQTKSRSFLILAALFLIALSVRYYYLLELSQNPFFDTVLKSFDHYNFDLGATNFAQGDWLAQSPNNTYSPLFKYFLGLIYFIFGRNFYVIYGIQFILGALGSVLIFLIGKKLFDARVGFLAFLGFAFYSTEILYEGIILRAAFITFLAILSFYSLLRLQESATPLRLVISSLILSLFFQSRPNTFICLPFVIVFLHRYIFQKWNPTERLKGWGMFLVPLFLSFAPILLQCYYVHEKFVFFDASGPTAFLAGNYIDYPGFGFDPNRLLQFQKENNLENLSPVSFVSQQIINDPFGFIGLYLRKIYFYFNDLEPASNISTYLYLESSKLLPYLLSHFSLFSSLGLMGIALAIQNKEKVFLLHSYLVSLIFSVIIFHVVARFRIPSVPFLILFSAYAVGRALNWLEKKEYKRVGLFGLIFLILLYGFRAPEDHVAVRSVDYCNWGYAHMLEEKWFDLEKAEDYGLECFKTQKRVNLDHGPGHVLMTTLYKLYGYYLISKSDERAEKVLNNLISIDPLSFEAYRMLAETEEKRGNVDSAIRNLHLSMVADRSAPFPLRDLIRIYYQNNSDLGRRLAALKAILPIEEDLEKAAMVKGQILKLGKMVDKKRDFINDSVGRAEKSFKDGQWEVALREYKSINAFNHSSSVLLLKQGMAHERLGNQEKSLAAYYDALLIDPKNQELNKNFGNYYFSMGENALAVLHWTKYLDVGKDAEDYQEMQNRLKSANDQLKAKNLKKQVSNLSPKENRELFSIFSG